MIGKDYLARQAATLLRLAHLTRDRKQSASLAAKAADLKARSDETRCRKISRPKPPTLSRRRTAKGADGPAFNTTNVAVQKFARTWPLVVRTSDSGH
jgi:hypothetical protein